MRQCTVQGDEVVAQDKGLRNISPISAAQIYILILLSKQIK